MSSDSSPFDKNLRSLMDAISMFEREASLLLDRLGFDTDAVGRALDTVGSFSADAVRPLAAALGIADAAAVDAVARDVRALLQSDARLRREQAGGAARLEELVAAIEALGTTTATLADLQSRTQERLDALSERAVGIDAVVEQRLRVLEDVDRLRRRIDDLEQRLATEMGMALPGQGDSSRAELAVKPLRRQMSRNVDPASSAHKILEGLPPLEPKVRPA